jgi:ribosomal protein S10
VNIDLHLDAQLQNEENTHSKFEISTHKRDVELPDNGVHSDLESERSNMEIRT